MAITAGTPPTRSTPVALARGFVTGGVIGTSLAALFVGAIIESVPLFVTGLGLPAVYGLLFSLAGIPRRAREAAVVPRTALAMIESLEAIGSESSDVPVRFDLTVAPDDVPAYRVEITQSINLVERSCCDRALRHRPARLQVHHLARAPGQATERPSVGEWYRGTSHPPKIPPGAHGPGLPRS